MSTPTDGPVDPFGPGKPAVLEFSGPCAPVLQLWARPLQPLLPMVRDSMAKPLAEITMTELVACLVTFGYIFASVTIGECMLLNLARVAVRGR